MEQKQCSLKDARILLMNEILQGIKVFCLLPKTKLLKNYWWFVDGRKVLFFSTLGDKILRLGETVHEKGGGHEEQRGAL